jgi:cell division septal protein FtsQ
MKFQTNSNKLKSRASVILFLLLCLVFIYLLSFFEINKFNFSGDLAFVDNRRLKILSLNLLKNQPIFWFNKSHHEKLLKEEFPQVENVSYRLVSLDTLEINIKAKEICCTIKDVTQKDFLISVDGVVLRELDFNPKTEIKFYYLSELNPKGALPNPIADILKQLDKKTITINTVKNNEFYINNDSVYFYTTDSKKVIFGQSTDLQKFNDNLKSMISFLDQNKKIYSILDFRFEKIVVK